jgi:hypothetical protein
MLNMKTTQTASRARTPCAVPLSADSRIANLFAGADLADAYAIQLPSTSTDDIETLVRFVLDSQASWFRALLRLRDVLVAGFGIKTSRQLRDAPVENAAPRIFIFRVYAVYVDEMILGEDDKHLDFRASVRLRSDHGPSALVREIVLTTVVHCHNRLGRCYIALIRPFHRLVVRSMLRQAALRGWPESTASRGR